MEVAVLLATYNSEKYIRELMESLKKQTFKDFICYIHDDGSTDTTANILQQYAAEGALNIKILGYPATGSARANFLSMLKYIEEPYVMFCDHDDVWLESKIETSLKAIKSIERENRPALAFSDLYVVNQDLQMIAESFMDYTGINPNRIELKHLLLENVAAGCTMIANKALYEIARNISSYDNTPMHDHWCMVVAATCGDIIFIKKPLIYYRQHEINELGATKNKSIIERGCLIFNKILKKDYKNELHKWIDVRQRQALELSRISGVSEENKALCRTFAQLNDCNKVRRAYFYYHNKILRSKYNTWFLLWC